MEATQEGESELIPIDMDGGDDHGGDNMAVVESGEHEIQVQIIGDASEAMTQVVQMEDGTQLSLSSFLEFQRQSIAELRAENAYLVKHFTLFHKFHYAYDLIREEYLDVLPNFKYRELLSDLEGDLDLFINEDVDHYTELMNKVNLDQGLTFNEADQFEFIQDPIETEEDEREVMLDSRRYKPGEKITKVYKLEGQKTAPEPICPVCNQSFRSRIMLVAHLQDDHEDDPTIICPRDDCEMSFNLKSYSQHLKNFHGKNDTVCDECNEMFPDRMGLIEHYKLHMRKKDRLMCSQPGCNYTDLYQGRLDRHRKMAHGIDTIKQFTCSFENCGRVFKDRPSFYTHSLVHKDRSLVYKHKCPHPSCGSAFKRRRNLTQHMLKHNDKQPPPKGKRITCPQEGCSKIFYREKEFKKHFDAQHAPKSKGVEKNKRIKLEVVSNELKGSYSQMNEAEVVPTDELLNEDFQAMDTGADLNESGPVIEFNSKNLKPGVDVMAALRSVTKGVIANATSNVPPRSPSPSNESPGDMTFESEIIDVSLIENPCCELCNLQFKSGSDMAEHLKEKHHQYTVRQYVCGFKDCHFSTYFRSVLGKHKNTEHGGKYKCEVCGKLSKDSGNHNRHRLTHKNVVYQCSYENCDARYKSNKAFYVHILSHTNEQPTYECDFPGCAYTTHYMNTLNVHKLTHSNVRRFFCPYPDCGKGFKRNGDLNKHVAHSHQGVKRPPKKRKETPASAGNLSTQQEMEAEPYVQFDASELEPNQVAQTLEATVDEAPM